jgi:methyltransferase (TIGR00027 family)
VTDTPISDVSDTALWVAAFRALESARPDALFKDPLAAVLTGDRGRLIAKQMPYPKMLGWMMAVRTILIDRLIFEALQAGVDTVINIGAGLDTRPYRLDLPQHLQWIEIDFPHMIDLKNTRLAQEVPRCKLKRIALNVANRDEAVRVYRELGSQSKQALIITEGVIAYLSNDEAGQLAQDLRSIPSFRFWIQDYLSSTGLRRPGKLKKKLKNAPFRFHHADPLGFFAEYGWQVRSDKKAIIEADKLGRPFPIPFPFEFLMFLIPKAHQERIRQGMGYVLLEARSAR